MKHTINMSYDDETNETIIEENCSLFGKLAIMLALRKRTTTMKDELYKKDQRLNFIEETENGEKLLDFFKTIQKGKAKDESI